MLSRIKEIIFKLGKIFRRRRARSYDMIYSELYEESEQFVNSFLLQR